jgi:hypothetical protein
MSDSNSTQKDLNNNANSQISSQSKSDKLNNNVPHGLIINNHPTSLADLNNSNRELVNNNYSPASSPGLITNPHIQRYVPYAAPNTNVQSFVPNTNVSYTTPNINVQPFVSNANVPYVAPNTNAQPFAPNTNAQPFAPNTNIPHVTPNTNVQSFVPNTNVPHVTPIYNQPYFIQYQYANDYYNQPIGQYGNIPYPNTYQPISPYGDYYPAAPAQPFGYYPGQIQPQAMPIAANVVSPSTTNLTARSETTSSGVESEDFSDEALSIIPCIASNKKYVEASKNRSNESDKSSSTTGSGSTRSGPIGYRRMSNHSGGSISSAYSQGSITSSYSNTAIRNVPYDQNPCRFQNSPAFIRTSAAEKKLVEKQDYDIVDIDIDTDNSAVDSNQDDDYYVGKTKSLRDSFQHIFGKSSEITSNKSKNSCSNTTSVAKNIEYVEYSKHSPYPTKYDYGIPLIKDDREANWFIALRNIVEGIKAISFKNSHNYITRISIIGDVIDTINFAFNDIALKNGNDDFAKMFVFVHNTNIAFKCRELTSKIFDIFSISEEQKETYIKYLNLLRSPPLLSKNINSEKDNCKNFYEKITKSGDVNVHNICIYGFLYITELLSIIVNSYIVCFYQYIVVHRFKKTGNFDIDQLYSFYTLFREIIKITNYKIDTIMNYFPNFSYKNTSLIDNTFFNYKFEDPSSYDGVEYVLLYFCRTILYYSKTPIMFEFKENKIVRSPNDADIKRMKPIKPIVKEQK